MNNQSQTLTKRKFSSDMPPSLVAHTQSGMIKSNYKLSGTTAFDNLKEQVKVAIDYASQSTQAGIDAIDRGGFFADYLLEELFRYLYLLARYRVGTPIQVSPSELVDQAFHVLLLDPELYYDICDSLMTLNGQDAIERPKRVLPHNAKGGEDRAQQMIRLQQTHEDYVTVFHHAPPENIWPPPVMAAPPRTRTQAPATRIMIPRRPARTLSCQWNSEPLSSAVRLTASVSDSFHPVTRGRRRTVTNLKSLNDGGIVPLAAKVSNSEPSHAISLSDTGSVSEFISVNSSLGGTSIVAFNPSDTIDDIKLKLELSGNIYHDASAGEMRLTFCGKILENDKTLSDYSVQGGSILHMRYEVTNECR
jgi:hypothetical protein